MFYLYNDPIITMNDWLSHITNYHRGHIDEDLYQAFKTHHLRTLDPEKASIFVIGMPMIKSYERDSLNHIDNFKNALHAISNNSYFLRNGGKDHLIIASDWKLSAWAPIFKNLEIKSLYISTFEKVKSTRYEVFNSSSFVKVSHPISSLLPKSMFYSDWELTRHNLIVPYKPYFKGMVTPEYISWKKKSKQIFYHSKISEFSHDATVLRHTPILKFQDLSNCSIGYDIPNEMWQQDLRNSKFVLVIRGDTPGSHAFINGIAAGCIPIIISDAHYLTATPFNDLINLEDYSVNIPEKVFLENPDILFETIQKLSDDDCKKMLNKLVDVQKMTLLKHPESKLCCLILDTFNK